MVILERWRPRPYFKKEMVQLPRRIPPRKKCVKDTSRGNLFWIGGMCRGLPWHGSCTGYKCNTFNSLHRFETASFLFIYQEGSDLPNVQGHDHAIIQWQKQSNHHWNTNLRSWYVIDLQSSMQTDSRVDVCVVVFDLFRSVREHLWDWIKFVSNISWPVGRTTSAWTKWDLMSPLLITV